MTDIAQKMIITSRQPPFDVPPDLRPWELRLDDFLPPDVDTYDSPVPGIPTDFVRRPELLTLYRAPFPPTLIPTDFFIDVQFRTVANFDWFSKT